MELVNDKQNGKVKPASKSFMTAGPALHYSHKNVQRCWLLGVLVFGLTCIFWSKIQTGSFLSFDLHTLISPTLWLLGRFTTQGVSIFEYPSQILVLGLLMGILAIVPVLISQLMSFAYSIPFILELIVLANLPGFGVSVLLSCVAVACRPLRFRSRFIAIVLCTAPQLLYFGLFSGLKGIEPIKLGFSFTPWICAWLAGLGIAGFVLGVGHFTRYRPGLVWSATLVVLLFSVFLFEAKVGFDELDYQLYVARNDPEQINEFRDHNITNALDKTIMNPDVRRYLSSFFYPSEPIALRAELKKEIQNQLQQGRWPGWFIVPKELRYQEKKQQLFTQYDLFIERRPRSSRMPIALYYKAILSEFRPDVELLGEKEILYFYIDYPNEESRSVWYRLYSEFGDSPEALEARWRIAYHWAGQGRFEQARMLLNQAGIKLAERLEAIKKDEQKTEKLFSAFRSPAASTMTSFKLAELQRRIGQLQNLISRQNSGSSDASKNCLSSFVKLNSHALDYNEQLNKLLSNMSNDAPLRDNVLLAQIKLIADEHRRAERLSELHKQFTNSDGGIQALYELGLLKINLWHQKSEADPQQKKKLLAQTRAILTSFISLYPDSIYTEQVKKNLDNLPSVK
ncbi:MAG: hypothetical protein JXB29_03880 [Sedimentisphaerales bacterium]|nr:hypothetical protein [Sedimentisphaerales bacterium]